MRNWVNDEQIYKMDLDNLNTQKKLIYPLLVISPSM